MILANTLIDDKNFLPNYLKKILTADRRPMVIIKVLTYELANENINHLKGLGFLEIISLKNKYNQNLKAVKLVCKDFC